MYGEDDPAEVVHVFHEDELLALPHARIEQFVQEAAKASENVSIEAIILMLFGLSVVLKKQTSYEGAWAGMDIDFSDPQLLEMRTTIHV